MSDCASISTDGGWSTVAAIFKAAVERSPTDIIVSPHVLASLKGEVSGGSPEAALSMLLMGVAVHVAGDRAQALALWAYLSGQGRRPLIVLSEGEATIWKAGRKVTE